MSRTVADLLVGVLERLEPAFHRTRPQRPRPVLDMLGIPEEDREVFFTGSRFRFLGRRKHGH